MEDFWEEAGWSEGKEQTLLDLWALQILTCPHRICRRARRCERSVSKGECRGVIAHPLSAEQAEYLRRDFRRELERVIAEKDRGEPPPAGDKERREEGYREDRRRRALAFVRVGAALKARRSTGAGTGHDIRTVLCDHAGG